MLASCLPAILFLWPLKAKAVYQKIAGLGHTLFFKHEINRPFMQCDHSNHDYLKEKLVCLAHLTDMNFLLPAVSTF